MPLNDRTIEDYLKVVYNTGEWSDIPVTSGVVGARLGLAASTVSEAVQKLTQLGLISHARYGAIALTPEGERRALKVVRKHRLIETFLVDYLGYAWDEVHDEAEILEHHVSDFFVTQLDKRLNHPSTDPHGDPIPGDDGALHATEGSALNQAQIGSEVTVVRVSDDDPAVLRELSARGIGLGARLTVTDHDGTQSTVTTATTTVVLSAVASAAIRVT